MLKIFQHKNLKTLINFHVDAAVEKAEQFFGSGNGVQKKAMATAYIMSFIKFPKILTPFVYGFLNKLISKSIELALEKFHSIQEKLMAGM